MQKILILGGNLGQNSVISENIYKTISKIDEHLFYLEKNVTRISICDNLNIDKMLSEIKNYDIIITGVMNGSIPYNLNLKEKNKTAMILNVIPEYSFKELMNEILLGKGNLAITVPLKNIDEHLLFDPLGTVIDKNSSIIDILDSALNRLYFLSKIHRFKSEESEDLSKIEANPPKDFLDITKDLAKNYYSLLIEKNEFKEDNNYLFRCQRGFPSYRENNKIFVSQRIIKKSFIDKEDFVPVSLSGLTVNFGGDKKPAIDAGVQLCLYKELKNIKYMVHSHVYIKGAPFTETEIPCGGLEEVEQIINKIDTVYKSRALSFYVINYKNHGSIVMTENLEDLKNINYLARADLENENYLKRVLNK